ncbi:MAG TPA: Fe-S cluster assembly protein SufD [Anaerolineaceae bacterium]|jgi:Fe-S cluster assembly protein SufD|nr:Fe-S cluster assembly protein SufD [Chloroflexota bacterium]HUM63971.1 Fe-S cluster assembly protein SufD [Anaerolineaceae bacterium]
MTENSFIIHRKSRASGEVQSDLNITPVFTDTNPFVQQYRQKAWRRYLSLSIPDSSQEHWRRTNLRGIDFSTFKLAEPTENFQEQFPRIFDAPVAGKENGGTILLSPFDAKKNVAPQVQKKGIIFETLDSLKVTQPQIIEKVLSRIDHDKTAKFSALAGALGLQGILLYVPKNVRLELPLQSIFWAAGEGLLHSLQLFVYLEEGSSVTYVHESSSPNAGSSLSLHAALIDVYVGPDAHLNLVELQSWGENIVNFTSENVQVDRGGSVDWVFGALGSRLTKNVSNLSMIGAGATGKMSGFYFTDHVQHLDHDTQQNHLAPNTTSDLLFKGALTDNSRSVWQGMIYVSPEANKADGYQANRNLVLSKNARADSIPGLEILTDDVRCTHGATVGKIDEDQVFYLTSRGMPRDDAERLIVEGFFEPIMQRIPFEGVRKRFQNAIKEKMEHTRN